MWNNLLKIGEELVKQSGAAVQAKASELINHAEYEVNQLKAGNINRAGINILKATNPATRPVYEAVEKFEQVENIVTKPVADFVEERTGVPAAITQTGLLMLTPGAGEVKPALRGAGNALLRNLPAKPAHALGPISLTGRAKGPQVFSNQSLDNLTSYRVRDQLARKNQRGGSGEYFTDDIGDSYRLDQKGKDANGKPTYSFQNQSLKNQRNQDVDPRRRRDGELTTHQPEGDDFYKNRSDANTDAHHLAELRRSARLYEGLDENQSKALYKYLKKRGITTGNSAINRAELSTKVHKDFHSWFDKQFKRDRTDLSKMNWQQRKQYIDRFIDQYKAGNEKIFNLRQQELQIKQ